MSIPTTLVRARHHQTAAPQKLYISPGLRPWVRDYILHQEKKNAWWALKLGVAWFELSLILIVTDTLRPTYRSMNQPWVSTFSFFTSPPHVAPLMCVIKTHGVHGRLRVAAIRPHVPRVSPTWRIDCRMNWKALTFPSLFGSAKPICDFRQKHVMCAFERYRKWEDDMLLTPKCRPLEPTWRAIERT